jgi:hydroxymethylbilane synthase
LAYAGLERLGLKSEISQVLNIFPAPGQGALAVEIRRDNAQIRQMVARINHQSSFYEIVAERSFLQRLGGGCNVPIACLARAIKGKIVLEGLVCAIDGSELVRHKFAGVDSQAEALGQHLADVLLAKGADKLLCR